jgi:hypothetical protein
MSSINNRVNDLYSIPGVQDLSHESAASISGGADVVLHSKSSQQGESLETDKGIKDLSKFNFDDMTLSVQVQNNQTWRFYEDANFMGDYEDVGPDEARNLGKLDGKVSSLKAIT